MREHQIYLTQFFEENRARGIVRSKLFKISLEDFFNLDPFGTGKAVGVHVVPKGVDSNTNCTVTEYCYYDISVYCYRVKDAKPILDLERCKELDLYWRT